MAEIRCNHGVGIMSHYKDTLLNLLPPVAYDAANDAVKQEIHIDALALDAAYDSAKRLTDVLNPATSGSAISDWERVYQLTRAATYSERVAAVMAKINAVGGLSIPYFIDLAASVGVTITIGEPQPFRAGVSRAGEALNTEDAIYLWQVNVLNAAPNITQFRAGQSTSGERLLSFGQFDLVELFNDLKPAHTVCHFNYLGV